MDEIPCRRRRRLVAAEDTHAVVARDDAGAARPVRLGDRLVGDGAAVEPEIAERPVRVAEEEAPDHRLVDLVGGAPDVEPLGHGEVRDPDTGRRPRVARRVERGHAPVGERPSPEQVLDPVAGTARSYADAAPARSRTQSERGGGRLRRPGGHATSARARREGGGAWGNRGFPHGLRRGWDSNPRSLAAQRFSRPPRSTAPEPRLGAGQSTRRASRSGSARSRPPGASRMALRSLTLASAVGRSLVTSRPAKRSARPRSSTIGRSA